LSWEILVIRAFKRRAVVAQALRAAPLSGMFARMRFMASLTALVFITACATASPSSPAAPSAPPAASPGETSRAAQLLAAAGSATAPTQADIERTFGTADIVRHDGAGAALTYRLQSCALLLVFSADNRNTMRLAQAHASARRSGEAAPSLAQCAGEAAARR
jgi:hypothetical protein